MKRIATLLLFVLSITACTVENLPYACEYATPFSLERDQTLQVGTQQFTLIKEAVEPMGHQTNGPFLPGGWFLVNANWRYRLYDAYRHYPPMVVESDSNTYLVFYCGSIGGLKEGLNLVVVDQATFSAMPTPMPDVVVK